MPPMSAWCAMLETKRASSPPENTGMTMATSGRCDPRPTNGSLEMNMSPGRISRSAVVLEDHLDETQHRREVQRHALALHDHPPAGVEDRGGVVPTLLDVGRVGALHERDVGLVRDAPHRVSEAPRPRSGSLPSFTPRLSSITRFPHASARIRSPGNTITVASSCSTTRGAPDGLARREVAPAVDGACVGAAPLEHGLAFTGRGRVGAGLESEGRAEPERGPRPPSP